MQQPFFIHQPDLQGPFDIIGDVHGCAEELEHLLETLGWNKDSDGCYGYFGDNRMIIFVGDLVDRGPDSPKVLQIAMDLLEKKRAFWVLGNHDDKLRRWLKGNKVKLSHGIQETIEQFESYPKEFHQKVFKTLSSLPSYLILDDDQLIVAHAGLKEKFHFHMTEKAHKFALFGQPTGRFDDHGYPIRYAWEQDYHGKPTIIFGHVAIDAVKSINNCIDIDTGCVFGGKLTAYRWPEGALVEVQSNTNWERPFIPQEHRD